MSARSWRVARRYVLSLLALGASVSLAGPRARRVALPGAAAAAGAVALFFRDPERPLQPVPGLVYAAADGVVTSVEPAVADPWAPGGVGCRIAVFLSLLDVHVNRSPVAGRVVDMEEIDGGYAPALFARAEDNRRTRLAIDSAAGRVVVVQVAGLLARSITSWVRPGDTLAAGQRLGLIHFGSRTDVLLPVDRTEVLVRVGDRVRAGTTPLARVASG